MTAAAPTSSETPILPFPVPRTPAFDRPPGMRGSRLPHHPETIAVVRLLYERTTLRHREIAEQAGVSRTSVHGWALAGGWKRPPGAPKSHQLRPERPAGPAAQGPHAGEAPARDGRALPRRDGEGLRRPRLPGLRRRAPPPQGGEAARAAAK